MIQSIYGKIFVWFWVAMLGVGVSVMVFALALGAQPLGLRWMSRTLDFYGRSAVDFYEHGGAPELQAYLDDIEEHSGIRATLIGPHEEILSDHAVPRAGMRLLKEAREAGKSKFHIGVRWTGASVVERPEGTYILVAQVMPLRSVFTTGAVGTFALRLGIALLSAGVLCWILARHIAGPIRALQTAAGRIANGELSVRAGPSIPPRNDELADLARDFDRMADRIEALLQRQQELLSEISHELRSPLARLGVSLELVRRGERDGVERMQADLDRLDDLIGRILTLARLQNEGAQKNETVLNLRAIVESVAEDARFEGAQEGKKVVIARAEDCRLMGDAALVRSCVENVVRNAVRYTKAGGDVEITVNLLNGTQPPQAQILVRDQGPGVPPEALPRLFEAFYRGSASRDRGTGGTGLGLTIAQRVAHFHGGSIMARNRMEGGLEVEIRLPAQPGSS